MRMRREFSVYDLAEGTDADPRVLLVYIRALRRCGVLRQTGWKSGGVIGRYNTYRLVKNLGPISPQVCGDGRLYDPNSETFIAVQEVQKS